MYIVGKIMGINIVTAAFPVQIHTIPWNMMKSTCTIYEELELQPV